MNVSYQAMAAAVPIVRGTRFDAVLCIDIAALGMSPNVWAERLANPVLTEILSGCYIFFMPPFFGSLLRYFFWRKELLAEFYVGLFTVYGLGFLGYLLVPAMGPYLAYPELFAPVALDGGPVTRLNTLMVLRGSNQVKHGPAFTARSRRSFSVLPTGIAGANSGGCSRRSSACGCRRSILRYHYLVDIVCGFVLAGFASWVTARFAAHEKTEEAGVDAPGLQR